MKKLLHYIALVTLVVAAHPPPLPPPPPPMKPGPTPPPPGFRIFEVLQPNHNHYATFAHPAQHQFATLGAPPLPLPPGPLPPARPFVAGPPNPITAALNAPLPGQGSFLPLQHHPHQPTMSTFGFQPGYQPSPANFALNPQQHTQQIFDARARNAFMTEIGRQTQHNQPAPHMPIPQDSVFRDNANNDKNAIGTNGNEPALLGVPNSAEPVLTSIPNHNIESSLEVTTETSPASTEVPPQSSSTTPLLGGVLLTRQSPRTANTMQLGPPPLVGGIGPGPIGGLDPIISNQLQGQLGGVLGIGGQQQQQPLGPVQGQFLSPQQQQQDIFGGQQQEGGFDGSPYQSGNLIGAIVNTAAPLLQGAAQLATGQVPQLAPNLRPIATSDAPVQNQHAFVMPPV